MLTYREMMHTYAEVAGLPQAPDRAGARAVTPSLSSRWVGLVTPLPGGLARPLVESLVNEVVVHDHLGRPRSAIARRSRSGESLELALRRVGGRRRADPLVRRRSCPATHPPTPCPTDPDWSGGTVFIDEQTAEADAPADAVFAVVAGIGGDRGWFVADVLWTVRGMADKLVGGVGMRRGRRHPDQLRVGDALDFWRVEAVRAAPPAAPAGRDAAARRGVAGVARRGPRGRAGRCCASGRCSSPGACSAASTGTLVLPFHGLIFGQLARDIARRAAATEGSVGSAR